MSPTLFLILLAAPVLSSTGPVMAGELPTEPILRIEIGTHLSQINRIAVDEASRYLVTGSEDKTVRVWELATGQLLKTLRFPVGLGRDGAIYAVALSPDGRTVAVGGLTKAGEDSNSIYIFDWERGDLVRRLTGLPHLIVSLAYSKDGKVLAATLGGNNGMRVYRTSDYTLSAEDRDYGGISYGADFDRDGRLVVSSTDGFIRLYNHMFQLIAKAKQTGLPWHVSFSPDGREIALGFSAPPRVAVLSGKDLSVLYQPDTSDVESTRNLRSVAWSADGHVLYASGTYQVKGTTMIRKWSDGGRGSFIDLVAAQEDAVLSLLPLRAGGIVYATGGPAFGIFNESGQRILYQESLTAGFKGLLEQFLVSQDGATVQFGYGLLGRERARFSLATRFLDRKPAADSDLVPPVTAAPGLEVTDWSKVGRPKLNGKVLREDKQGWSFCLAIAPRGTHVLLGGVQILALFNRVGRQEWEIKLPAIAWSVNITGNSKLAVAALADGTIRWYRMSDGKELAALFPHADRKSWVLWTPSGYFDASEGAEDLIGWHVNQGKDKEALFYPASRFFDQFYRPDIVAEVIKSGEPDVTILARLGERERVTMKAAIKLPPKVAIVSPRQGEQFDRDEVEIHVQVDDQGGGIDDVRLYHNGKVVGTSVRNLQVVGKSPTSQQTKVFTVRLVDGSNEFRAVALSRDRIESHPYELTIALKAVSKEAVLHVLVVGINDYKNPALNLNFALPDAQGILKFFGSAPLGLFKEVKKYELQDGAATKPAILANLQALQATAPQDVVVVYLAGHGESLENIWYFIPYEIVTPEREEAVKQQALSSVELREHISKIGAQKVLLLIDACKSGSAMVAFAARGLEDRKALAQLARSTGVHVVAASTKEQEAAEVKEIGHGVFTYTILEALSGKADGSPKDGTITVRELLAYVESRLPEVSLKYKTQAQYPVVDSRGMDFPIAMVR